MNAAIFFGDSSVTLDNPIGDKNNSPVVIKKYPNIAKELEELVEKARSDMGDNLTGRKGINNRNHGKL